MNIVAIIQARMSSTRLPGKVMKEIVGKPMLALLIERVRRSQALSEVVIATGDVPANRPIIDLGAHIGCPVFVGSEDDCLDRFYRAAKQYSADVVVRITGDCPLHDHGLIDEVVGFFLKNVDRYDYVSNVNPPTFPDGLDLSVFSFLALEKTWREATLPSEREHICPYIWKHPELFRIGHLSSPIDYSSMRWTVDDPLDFEFVRNVFEHLYRGPADPFSMEEILRFTREHPELDEREKRAARDEGYGHSVLRDARGHGTNTPRL